VGYFLLFAALLFLLLAPIQGRLLEAQGHIWLALTVTWLGFVWMGFLYLFICLSLPLDTYHLLIGMGQRLTGCDWTGWMLSRRQSIGIAIIAACGLMAYGALEARRVETRAIRLHSAKIPSTVERIRIVQISDVHAGLMTYPGRLSAAIQAIKQAKPDIVVSTGDLVDSHVCGEDSVAASLREIQAPLGKFAVTGNHEFYMGIKNAQAFTKAAGFTLLQGKPVSVNNLLTIIGVDDPAIGKPNGKDTKAETELLTGLPGNQFPLLLKHRPTVDSGSRGKFDLQLSGHTHQGQIFPFGYLVSLGYPLGHGLRKLSDGSYVYISTGTGTWGPPIRVLAPPEITVIDIVAMPTSDQGEDSS
jgi:predicted MPP superfamily phosphohydrolase